MEPAAGAGTDLAPAPPAVPRPLLGLSFTILLGSLPRLFPAGQILFPDSRIFHGPGFPLHAAESQPLGVSEKRHLGATRFGPCTSETSRSALRLGGGSDSRLESCSSGFSWQCSRPFRFQGHACATAAPPSAPRALKGFCDFPGRRLGAAPSAALSEMPVSGYGILRINPRLVLHPFSTFGSWTFSSVF